MCTKVHALQIDNKVLTFMIEIDKINEVNRSQLIDMRDV